MKRFIRLLSVCSTCAVGQLTAADIVALVIGNNAYARVEDQLDTPVNDATLMQRTLEALPGGADVKLLTDAKKEDIEIALNALKLRAQGARLALVFYSGHGTEDQPDGFAQSETFLLPVDATIPDVNYLPTRAVALGTILSALKAAPVTARAVILDCCRNGAPKATGALIGSTKSAGDLDERVKRALGNAVVPEATLIAFAASPGRKAAAFLTDSDENSPFTKFISEELSTGSGDLRKLIGDAAFTTETRTGRRQVPYVTYTGAESAIRQITFRSSPALMPAIPPAGPAPAPVLRPSVAVTMSPAPAVVEPSPVVAVTPVVPASPTTGSNFKSSTGMLLNWVAPLRAWVGVTEVTQSVYRNVIGDNPSYFEGDMLPVNNVTWHEAQRFCQLLTIRDKEVHGQGFQGVYMLPTDQDYSVFAEGTRLSDAIISSSNGKKKRPATVGSLNPNAHGLFDVRGNVWEWLEDPFSRSMNSSATNAKLANGLASTGRVLRGGSYSTSDSTMLDLDTRASDRESQRDKTCGFRVILKIRPF